MYLTNLTIAELFFIDSYEILQNDAFLINHESFFQEKESPQLYHSQFSEINSLMAKIIKIYFPKQNSYKSIAEFGNNLNLERKSCKTSNL